MVTFGRGPADVRAEDVRLDDRGRPGFRLVSPAGSGPVQLRLYGGHNVSNALAAAALAGELGMPGPEIAERLSEAEARSRWRMEVTERPDGVTVLNDAYNANPEAVRSALDTLAVLARGRRSFAVLGPMSELGAHSRTRHEEIGRYAAQAGLTGLIVVGEEAGPILTGAKAEPSWGGELIYAPDASAALDELGHRLAPGRRCAGEGVTLGRPGAGRARLDRGGAHGPRTGGGPGQTWSRDRQSRADGGTRGDGTLRTILLSAGISLLLSLFGTPLAIKIFSRRGYGQLIREEGPAGHATKRGTPTMGGTVIVIAAVVGYFVGNIFTGQEPSVSGVLVMFLMVGLGVVGFLDDFIKIYKQRSLGLRSGAKLAGQAVVGAVFALLVVQQHFADGYDLTPADAHLSFLRDFGPAIGVTGFMLWIVFLIAGTSNAVNLTDGLDGLATGCACLALAAYVLIGNWQLRNDCTAFLAPHCYDVRDPLDLAVVAASVLGACFGFLWWNAPPARIFMGDTGSLALGGVLAGLAVCTKTQLLLAILGGIFVVIALSVIIQVGSFKMTGRRVFRMAPLQHHFELKGWAETTIVIRFWLISAMFVALGLGVFYVEWMPK